MPTRNWKYELQTMGIRFDSTSSPIDQLLPTASTLWHMYREDYPPHLDISHLGLEEVLSHFRIAHQRLRQIDRKLKTVQRQLNSWFRRKSKTPHIKAQNIEPLLLHQQMLMKSHRQFTCRHYCTSGATYSVNIDTTNGGLPRRYARASSNSRCQDGLPLHAPLHS